MEDASVLELIIGLITAVLMFGAMWKLSTKAGQPGWAGIIPIYNLYVMLKVAGKPGWWLILLFIPIVNFIILILAEVEIARNFGKGGGFAVGLILLPIIFYPILAFGSAQYIGSSEEGFMEIEEKKRMEDDVVMRLLLPVGRSGYAIAAGYLGLVSVSMMFAPPAVAIGYFGLLPVFMIPAPLALIFGILGITDIKKTKNTKNRKYGLGRAIFGVIMGGLFTLLLLFLILSGQISPLRR